ncbi:hypothetical protein ISG33_08695 [Glaciecola sp. MH2013]|uniref:hypothetical protein n=1 Tax=Glaciecola sp. MH2013 TaxID=2785524 RepID=UPI0018A0B8AC|nr:hypothetical protein [Glaciecola sp. MH2013]MBF7073471.1 hypothetical protein [Glaciecola sp. MH2013]
MKRLLITLGALLFSMNSYALLITSNAEIDTDNRITFTYDIQANLIDTYSFELLFDYALFDNIELDESSVPAGWDPLVLQSVPDFWEDGLVNFLADFDPLPLGSSILGLVITADYLGGDTPTNIEQNYEIYGDDGFSVPDFDQLGLVLPNDFGQLTTSVTSVSSPSAIALLLSGLGFVLMQRRGSKK